MQNPRAAEPSRFATVLKRYRVAAGLSQEELAEKAGLSVRGISDLERGARTSPRLETVRMIADALALADGDRVTLLAAARPELAREPERQPESAGRTISFPRPPVPPTRLVGRSDELAELLSLFESRQARLITLTGQGGIGKSRLAVAAARALGRAFPDGVTFVDLSAVRDASLIPGAIAAHLDVRPSPGESVVQALIESIGDASVLLVLDNWEHVLEASTIVAELLASCEGLAVLSTSRERLRLRGEWEIALEPLAVPDQAASGESIDIPAVMEIAAVQLFFERAAESAQNFSINEDNVREVIGLCRQLEGLPLAIELAAARSRLLTPASLRAAMSSRLELLADGPRDLPLRQQTMRAAIAWSYDLLDEHERTMLAWLSVFVGGFTVEAAGEVARRVDPNSAGDDPGANGHAAQDAITSLTEKSLLRVQDRSSSPFRLMMPETIREFAQEQLRGSGQFAQLSDAHATHFLELAERREPELMGPDPMPCFHDLERDLGNLRAAMAWLQGTGHIEDGLRLAGALGWFWTEPRYLREGREWFDALLGSSAGAVRPEVRAKALVAAGDLAQWQFDTSSALRLHEEGAQLWRQVGDIERIAGVLRSLASVALEQREYERAEELLAESRNLAMQTGNTWEVAATTNLLGISEVSRGLAADAIARHLEAVQIWEELGDAGHVVAALGSLAWASALNDQLPEAARYYGRALAMARDLDDIVQIAWCVTGAAVVAFLRDHDARRAMTLFSAADRARQTTGTPTWASTQESISAFVERGQSELGEDAFAAAWYSGQNIETAEALLIAERVFQDLPPAV